ncbi:MAG: pyridoxamine 5'-phosphate oxidase [Porticoccaceae bacterium]|jgi:pyridoxamine 5'-phosphate oxidase|nr:pyridoxamine 5'-phosphate oxidase [Porticoccaceae bacterium]
MSLEQHRREYRYGRLTRASLNDSPFAQFQRWLDQALNSDMTDPTAMSVATVDDKGRPWQRIVLLKGVDERGFVFYTNLGSRKVAHIKQNPNVCLHFPWLPMDRQVIVAGTAERISTAEVLNYFVSRPRDSQLAAWASKQSSRISSRQALEAQFMQMREKFRQGAVPLPDFWGGFRVAPREFEFWQGGENRLHDRFQYLLGEGGQWSISRLAP